MASPLAALAFAEEELARLAELMESLGNGTADCAGPGKGSHTSRRSTATTATTAATAAHTAKTTHAPATVVG